MQLDIDPTGAALDDFDRRTKEVKPHADAAAKAKAELTALQTRGQRIESLYLGFCNKLVNGHAIPKDIEFVDIPVVAYDGPEGEYWKVLRVDSIGSVLVSKDAWETEQCIFDYIHGTSYDRNGDGKVEHLLRHQLSEEEMLEIMYHLANYGYTTIEGDEPDNMTYYFGARDDD